MMPRSSNGFAVLAVLTILVVTGILIAAAQYHLRLALRTTAQHVTQSSVSGKLNQQLRSALPLAVSPTYSMLAIGTPGALLASDTDRAIDVWLTESLSAPRRLRSTLTANAGASGASAGTSGANSSLPTASTALLLATSHPHYPNARLLNWEQFRARSERLYCHETQSRAFETSFFRSYHSCHYDSLAITSDAFLQGNLSVADLELHCSESSPPPISLALAGALSVERLHLICRGPLAASSSHCACSVQISGVGDINVLEIVPSQQLPTQVVINSQLGSVKLPDSELLDDCSSAGPTVTPGRIRFSIDSESGLQLGTKQYPVAYAFGCPVPPTPAPLWSQEKLLGVW